MIHESGKDIGLGAMWEDRMPFPPEDFGLFLSQSVPLGHLDPRVRLLERQWIRVRDGRLIPPEWLVTFQ